MNKPPPEVTLAEFHTMLADNLEVHMRALLTAVTVTGSLPTSLIGVPMLYWLCSKAGLIDTAAILGKIDSAKLRTMTSGLLDDFEKAHSLKGLVTHFTKERV